jgi:beta-1,4-mannosyltransferase
MHVHHYPYDKEGKNPYQKLMCQALELNDVQCIGLPGFFWKLIRFLLFSNGRVLHFHWMHGIVTSRSIFISLVKISFLYPLLIFWKLRNKSIFWTVHNLENHEKRYVFFDRLNSWFIAKLSDIVLVHGANGIDLVSDKFKINKQKIHVVHHGNYKNIIFPKSSYIKNGVLNFFYFGNIRRYKGVDRLLDVFHTLDSAHKLHIAGRVHFNDTDLRSEIIAKSDTMKNVTLELDYISNKRLEELLAWSNIVVLPFTETLTSGSLLMALTAGRPVIVPRTGLIPEYVNSECAFLYDPKEERGLANALSTVCQTSPEQLKIMSKAALKQSNKYDWGRISQELAFLYQSFTK